MTIRLLADYSVYPVNAIVTLDAATEAGLIAAKLADTNLAAGAALTPGSTAVETIGNGKTVGAGRSRTYALEEGRAVNLVGAAGTTGVAALLDAVTGAVVKSWSIAVGPVLPIGAFAGTQKIQVSCWTGSVSVSQVAASVGAAIMVTDAASNVTGLSGPNGQFYGLGIFSATQTDFYGFALRSYQAGFGSPLDQSGKLNDPQINATLFPQARANITALTVGQYRSPATLNGKLYKVTTAGATGAAEPAGMGAAAIGSTVADGAAVYTVERGPWCSSASGFQHFASISSALLPGPGYIQCPAVAWDMAKGDSIIIRMRQAWNANANDSRTPLSESVLLANRHGSVAPRSGIQITGTGSSFDDIRIMISDGTNSVQSGHCSTTLNRKPLDGNMHDVLIAIDGKAKRSFFWIDGQPLNQAEMFDGTNATPHNMDLSTITGSTFSANPFLIGSVPGNTNSIDFGMVAFDVMVLPGRALPVNAQALADFFFSRGAAAMMPAALMNP